MTSPALSTREAPRQRIVRSDFHCPKCGGDGDADSVRGQAMTFAWTGLGCDLCGFGTVENVDEFDPMKPCPECGTVNLEKPMNKEFAVHMLNDDGKAKAARIALAFNRLLEELTEPEAPLCPPGRETALVRTKLEEACFFAKKAMAGAPGNT